MAAISGIILVSSWHNPIMQVLVLLGVDRPWQPGIESAHTSIVIDGGVHIEMAEPGINGRKWTLWLIIAIVMGISYQDT